MNIADGGHDRRNPHALGVHLLRVSPTDIDPVRPSFEVIDAPLVSLEGQDLSGTLQDSGASPKRSEYEMLGTLNGVPTVDGVKYPCSSLGVNSAISASIAAGGGTVDARPCPSLSSYTSEIDVGNGSSVAVTLLLPSIGSWSCNITDGASYCLKVFNNGAAIGSNAGYGVFQIQPANSNVNVGALCGNDTSLANAHIRVEGFSCNIFSGTGTVTKAVGTFSGLGDGSYIGHMTFGNLSSTNATKVLWVNNACCSTTIEDTVADAFSVVGVTPCWFGNGTTGPNLNIKADGLTCVHPGNGASNLVDQEWNQFGNNVFKNVYMERSRETDTTTPWISVQKFGSPTAADYFVGVTAGGDVAGSTRYDIDIASGAHAILTSLQHGGVSTNAINDHNGAGRLVTAAANSTIGGYSTENQFFNGLVNFGKGLAADGNGFKHKRVTGCTTGATAGNNCETTVTWTTAFADANYTPVCTLLGTATLGHLAAISTSAIAAASVRVQTVTDTNAAITGTINCIAVHD